MFLNLYAEIDSFSSSNNLKGTKANLYNGAVSEHISSSMYKKNGFSMLDAEVGRNGIDGLYVKRDGHGNIKNIVFSEVKHGNGKLGVTKGNIQQMSKKWQINKLDDKLKSLDKDIAKLKKATPNSKEIKKIKSLQKELNKIKNMVKSNSSKVKSQITRVTNFGDGEYSVLVSELKNDGINVKNGKDLKYKQNDNIINLRKRYKRGSEDWKQQEIIKHSIKKQNRILKEKDKLNKFIQNQQKFTKNSKRYKSYAKNIKQQKYKLKMINKSRPAIFKGVKTIKKTSRLTAKASQIAVPAIVMKKGKKILVFMDMKAFGKSSKLASKFKFLKKVKGADVIMMTIESGAVVYSVMRGGLTYSKVSSLLVSGGKKGIGHGFSKAVAFLTPPPAGIIIAIAGTIAIEYAIDKYIEMDKRQYIGLEDMLWDVPDEIKNKITALNLEDTKRETVFDFGDIDKETILDDEADGTSIFDEDTNDKETIFD